VTGGSRELHDEELHNLCTAPSIIRMIKLTMSLVGLVARRERRGNAYRIFVGKPEGQISDKMWWYGLD
jgi:hypothetical protein